VWEVEPSRKKKYKLLIGFNAKKKLLENNEGTKQRGRKPYHARDGVIRGKQLFSGGKTPTNWTKEP